MSRFREEVYAPRRRKEALAGRKSGTAGSPEADQRESRAIYFQKPLSVRKAIHKAQKGGQARLV